MSRILDHAHQSLKECFHPGAVIVDATVGNGLDTAFILRHENVKTVYAFDVQEDAIKVAKTLNPSHKVTWILDSHANVDLYVHECDGAIFNLGFLPGSSSPVTTTSNATLLAITKLLNIIKPNGLLVVVYPGHDEGKIEHEKIQTLISTLQHPFYAYVYKRSHHTIAPYVLSIYKQK
jgi:2-polyprenyl-3-methyl-5-hydroxy-6-metoxy-1,4-benzoquinol methylase